MESRLKHGLVAVIVDGRPADDDRNESMPVGKAQTREKYIFPSDFLYSRERTLSLLYKK